ncbi:Avirulence (Avh) protein [Phytophthora megakarya]|uniref:Avirulence (Avh) protein n=1 Tax=Phytophthora megakarya TaxID=4795 RepID=A0A225VNF6_9STRA|nr:Avirulence (Avh) protein [Phytophthora megakarya]
MRILFYVAVAVTVLVRSSVGEVFTIADASNRLSKTTPNFADDFTIHSDPQKRFLRATGSNGDDLIPTYEA